MHKKTPIHIFLIIFLMLIAMTGCTELLTNSTTYTAHPTKISYSLLYGYQINCSGTGSYEINYTCNIPAVLLGSATYELVYNKEYTTTQVANNTVIQWNIEGKNVAIYNVGIRATVEATSFLIGDLTGSQALTLHELNANYASLINQYCNAQVDSNTIYIDPNHTGIKRAATTVLANAQSNNSFILAKDLFIWLKLNTRYQVHEGNPLPQPASTTLSLGTGDCDDLSYLYISLCRSIGLPARFVRGYLITNENDIVTAFPHAWAEVFVGGNIGNHGWVPVECACCASDVNIEANVHQNFGIEDAYHLRLSVDDGSNASINASLSGISSLSFGSHISFTTVEEVTNYTIVASQELIVTQGTTRSYR